jgi:hypothetical protein
VRKRELGDSRGSRQKADWLADQIDGGAITRRAAADAIGIDPADLDPILSGRVTISSTAWRKIAALAAPGA